MTIEEYYNNELGNYDTAVKLVTAYLQPFAQKGGLITKLESRIKTLDSLKQKCQRKKVSAKDIREKIRDIAGVRCICVLSTRMNTLVESIRRFSLPGFLIKCEKDYNTQRKDNGYSAFHFDCEITVPTPTGNVSVPVEIQIRTPEQDAWSVIEHNHYKMLQAAGKTYEQDSKRNNEILSEMAEHVKAIDKLALKLYGIVDDE